MSHQRYILYYNKYYSLLNYKYIIQISEKEKLVTKLKSNERRRLRYKEKSKQPIDILDKVDKICKYFSIQSKKFVVQFNTIQIQNSLQDVVSVIRNHNSLLQIKDVNVWKLILQPKLKFLWNSILKNPLQVDINYLLSTGILQKLDIKKQQKSNTA